MNDKTIWDFLYEKIGNPYGVAALMGNLYVESHLNPKDLQGSYARKFGMTDDQYTAAVDNGSYAKDKFVRDSAGYGLAQWTYWSRKASLYDFAKNHGKSIGDLGMQLEFLWSEIQSYKTVVEAMKTGSNIREISDVICKRYEKPTNQSEGYLQNRANYGQSYFNKYGKAVVKVENENMNPVQVPVNIPVTTTPAFVEFAPAAPAVTSKAPEQKRVVAKANVNIRSGNGKNYPRIGVLKAGDSAQWIASSADGWHAFATGKDVGWVSGEFAEVVE